MNSSYYCRLTNIKQLRFFYSSNVRWINTDVEYDFIKEYFGHFNVHNDTDTYFGINLANIKKEYSINEFHKGRLCGYIADNKILSLAGVEFGSSDEWEICAVSSRPDYKNKGYSKAVCSFIAKYILENNKHAICETNITNFSMQKVTKQIGMTQY